MIVLTLRPAPCVRDHLEPGGTGLAGRIYECSCGIEGCGVVAPVIVPSPDGRRVSWVDFRDYVGVFVGPTARNVDLGEGRTWPIRDLHFDRGQYIAEIRRASADRSWETARRGTVNALTTGRAGEAARIRCPVWAGVGSEDPIVPAVQRDAFAAEMQAAGVDWRLVIYGGALHAFHHPPTRADQSVLPGVGYHPPHAQRAWRDIVDLLAECLPVTL